MHSHFYIVHTVSTEFNPLIFQTPALKKCTWSHHLYIMQACDKL